MSFTITKGGTSVVLRNPDSDDVRRVTLNDIRRFTRSGDFCGLSDADHWAQANYYVYKFSALTNVLHVPPVPVSDYIIDQLKDFLKDNAGLEITWRDHLTINRTGYIVSPINEIIYVRPDCSFSVSLEILEKPV